MSCQPSDLLRYLPDFKVVVCTSCQYALQPSAISRHLKDIHHILRSSRKPFAEYVSTLDLAKPEAVIRSTDTLAQFPVAALPVQDGLKCSHQGCSHMCVTEKRMKSHWNVKHGRPGLRELNWTVVPLQTFFRGNSLRYFMKPSLSLVLSYETLKKSLDGEIEAALLQHYITSTSITLANGVETLSIWQEVMPQLAKRYPFLMYGLLICSALHLAWLRPSERQSYLITAATFQDLAMPLFRAAIAKINTENCNAIFSFHHLLAISSFAMDQENDLLLLECRDGPVVLSHWLFLLRSGCEYVTMVRDSVKDGALKTLLCDRPKYLDIYKDTQTPLKARLLAIIPSADCEDAWSEQECQIYRNAVHHLDHAFACAEGLGTAFDIWVALKAWPILLSPDYLQLLHYSHPGALIALSHYCVLLHKLDGIWYCEGRAKRISGDILQRLDPKWHTHIKIL
ncbi:hypothetical protein P154DRAFT_424955 [Amniculicola lignicola CBS 123094]|uniref:C2H2-type domain-containing protein n=1 Tax=Amniculicola lignicola CBS 123094 TaxID=1392246 RepID=A0A6A5X279_9PLEO|nr:hypothetical protein P154DRAFT_424955 [Amniculicola lignicola CBS 123094]